MQEKLIKFVRENRLGLIGVLVGGILGFAYYHFIGCATGTCLITSKPINSSVYGMFLGYLIFSIFDKTKQQKNSTNL
ncbi:hypothetical protein SAMN05421847_1305 [Halpernia humi]|uniref:Uncharacterized protein n=1 Tax=Halpernia humi TaxID=493375 RepID=A0A1H5WRB2_9FLAO|nr:DUF6132 family protein [Halpernia humi]SEG01901.1 hypothetical protein SAMN05421847_1305 [Halpernia humi]